jgi:glutathione S-transferase
MRGLASLIFCLITSFGFAQDCPNSLTLYYSPYCPYSHRVLDYLKEINKTVALKSVAGNKQARDELKEKGGKAQVPCLFIDEYPLYESDDIIQWLCHHQECLENSSKPEDLPE